MQSSVLGKRTQSYSESSSCSEEISIPERTSNLKRLKTSSTIIDVYPDCNKENVPPLTISPPPTPLRRSSTSVVSAPERRTPRRHSSESHPITPATSLAHLSLITPPPTPPQPLTPIQVRARALLRPVANGATPISGRVEERHEISEFISAFLNSGQHSIGPSLLYISGSPGTGKTALVNAILTELDVPFTIVNINCMALKDIDSFWERINDELSSLTCKKVVNGKAKGLAVTKALLSTISKCVLVLDELDHIMTCSQSLKSLSSLSQANSSKLRIIGIANTHTLTSSPSHLEYDGTNCVTTLHFSPYSPEQLLDILQTRLHPLYSDPLLETSFKQLLPVSSLTLLAKKIASQTGDVRALFEALRSAIDISIAATRPKQNPLDCTHTVTPANILSALKAYALAPSTSPRTHAITGSSEIVAKVHNLGLHGRFILLSLSLACRRLESKIPVITPTTTLKSSTRSPKKCTASISAVKAGVDAAQLYLYYTNLLVKGSGVFNPVSRSEFGDVINMLETHGLVTSSSSSTSPTKLGRKPLGRTSSFTSSVKSAGSAMLTFVDGVRMDEIMRGLGVGQSQDEKTDPDVKEEEMRIIWDKEVREIRRQASGNTHNKVVASGGFEDMSED